MCECHPRRRDSRKVSAGRCRCLGHGARRQPSCQGWGEMTAGQGTSQAMGGPREGGGLAGSFQRGTLTPDGDCAPSEGMCGHRSCSDRTRPCLSPCGCLHPSMLSSGSGPRSRVGVREVCPTHRWPGLPQSVCNKEFFLVEIISVDKL